MATKKYDLAVKVGNYTDSTGQEKNKYQNVGVVLEGANGPFLLLNRYFNPAGVPCDPQRDSIIVSMFSPRMGSESPTTTNEQDVPF